MNYVIFARDARMDLLPRFANALVGAGHQVYVLTVSETGVCDGSLDFSQFDSRILGTCIPVGLSRRWLIPSVSLRYQMFADDDIPSMSKFVSVTRHVLSKYYRPILVTFGSELSSHCVGWFCRKHASRWVAHVGDSESLEQLQAPARGLKPIFNRLWARRIIGAADLLSITSDEKSVVEAVQKIS